MIAVVKQRLESLRAAVRTWQPPPRRILFVAWLVLLVYAFPGYMNFDVGEQLYQIRAHKVNDYHPPIMGGYWRVFELFVSGPFPMLMLQTSLYLWGLYTLLATRIDRQKAAWVASALLLFPPLLTPMGMIWKDAQMSAFLIAGTALVLKESRRARLAGCLLFLLAAGVRFNGPVALPVLCWAATSAWTSRGKLFALVTAAALTIGLTVSAMAINRVLTQVPSYNWYRTTALIDIVGTTCFAPPLSDDEVRQILDGVELVVTSNLQQTFCERYPAGKGVVGTPPWYQYSEMFDWTPSKTDRLARRHAWKTLITTYPAAYVQHRATLAMDMMGLNGAHIWEPVGQDFAANDEHLRRIHHDHYHSWFQRTVGNACRWLAEHTPLYRVWIYALLGLVFLGWALYKRDWLVVTLSGAGMLYELSLAIGVNAPDFRYSHFMLSCVCLSAVLIAVERWRSARPR